MRDQARSIELLLTAADEAQLISAVRKMIPGVRLIEGSIWPTPQPPLVTDLVESRAEVVYLWDPRARPSLTGVPTTDGRWRGPTAGPVVQLERSDVRESRMLAGSLSAGYREPAEAEFAQTVLAIARRLTTNDLFGLDGSRLPYRAGAGALSWVAENEGRRFGAKNSPVLFLPRALLSRI